MGLQTMRQEKTATEHGMSLQVLLDLKACRLRERRERPAAGIQLPQQELETNEQTN